MSKKYQALILIILIGTILRFYGLTTSPEGLSIDETSIGYNAYSILTTGNDEHGEFMPFFFEAFGEYKLPIFIYLVAFSQIFLEQNDLSIRLPAALFGILSIPMIFLLTNQLLYEKSNRVRITSSIVSALLMAISPWHYQFSRPGFEAGVGIFFLMLAIYLFFKAKNIKSTSILLLSFLAFALTLYSYNSARIVVPILILSLFILFNSLYKKSVWLISFLFLLIILIPFIFFILDSSGWSRAKDVVVFYYLPFDQAIKESFKNYLYNISPVYLFLSGDPTIARDTSFRWGLLHLIELPFLLFGVIKIIQERTRIALFILIYLIVGFIPSAITFLSPHALRGLIVLPVLIIISAFGFTYFIEKINLKYGRKIVFTIYILYLIISEAYFLYNYHYKYLPNSGWDWQVGIKRTTDLIKIKEKDFDVIFFEEKGSAKISYFWYLKYPPQQYQNSFDKLRLGKYYFGATITDIKGGSLFVTQKCNLSEGKLIATVKYPNGTISNCIWLINDIIN